MGILDKSQAFLSQILGISKAYLRLIKGIYLVYLNAHSPQNIIQFILIWLFITFIDTEIFAAYAGSCLFWLEYAILDVCPMGSGAINMFSICGGIKKWKIF